MRRTEGMLLKSRAYSARTLVAAGKLDWLDAIAYTVWPTDAILAVEELAKVGTLNMRAHSTRLNP